MKATYEARQIGEKLSNNSGITYITFANQFLHVISAISK